MESMIKTKNGLWNFKKVKFYLKFFRILFLCFKNFKQKCFKIIIVLVELKGKKIESAAIILRFKFNQSKILLEIIYNFVSIHEIHH